MMDESNDVNMKESDEEEEEEEEEEEKRSDAKPAEQPKKEQIGGGGIGEPAKDANKPVAINSVMGTPWCVVWTGDMRSFFYNAVSKESHWVMPDELKGNAEVVKLLKSPPNKSNGKLIVFPDCL